MAFEGLSGKLTAAFKRLKNKGKLSEDVYKRQNWRWRLRRRVTTRRLICVCCSTRCIFSRKENDRRES